MNIHSCIIVHKDITFIEKDSICIEKLNEMPVFLVVNKYEEKRQKTPF